MFFSLDDNENSLLRKTVIIHNRGNTKALIHDISFGQLKCFGQGFSVLPCKNIEIEPNEKYSLKIL